MPTKFLAWLGLEVDCATRALVYALDLASLNGDELLASQSTIPQVGTPTNEVISAHYM